MLAQELLQSLRISEFEHPLDSLDVNSVRVWQCLGGRRGLDQKPSCKGVQSPARIHKRKISVGDNDGGLFEAFEDPRRRPGIDCFSLELENRPFPARTVRQ